MHPPEPSAVPAITPAVTAIPPATKAAIVDRLHAFGRSAAGAYAPNSERALRADLRVWRQWCAAAGAAPLPADAAAVAVFVDEMACSRAPATVRRYLASLALVHRAAELADPTRANVVRLAMKRLARTKGTRQRQAAPITERHVARILAAAGDGLAACRDVALLLVARDLLARRSELVALSLADVAHAEDGSGTARIARAKTDQAGQGTVGYLSARTMAAVERWSARAGITHGPIFRALGPHARVGRPLDAGEVPRIFRALITRAGLDPAGVSGHSARVGMAQDLTAAGADLPAVMQAGRWKTAAMPARYAEHLSAAQGAVAGFYGRRPPGRASSG